ncbi:MAG: tRNA (adenosine(37)-N6)-threonylcarbamoyltransferase complex ATPase subunit type 1 TsaE [Gammaproteobacteria bacterium GWE2_42_36]|nr:MAG: tRNA (adenosine(37)-N6)-threonylcarbamoyltransferase complex ATPase subunit type 1 TsaE [Gammaproteobacteria bacterium GWE2_42_36]HCU05630.1 tRNA (adenosine(37)-N6)-threonylcarbamoyltransferase complex ATPase subunit type 1 TsaE [Coxiellaceae bacterium]
MLAINQSILIKTENEMRLLGQKMAMVLPPVITIFLYGELGAGKTTLVRAIIQSFDAKQIVRSPTFTIVEPYEIDHRHIYHFDLYRFLHAEELDFIGAREYFGSGICLVEWPEKGEGFLPVSDLDCYFEIKDDTRLIRLQANTRVGEGVVARRF